MDIWSNERAKRKTAKRKGDAGNAQFFFPYPFRARGLLALPQLAQALLLLLPQIRKLLRARLVQAVDNRILALLHEDLLDLIIYIHT